MQSIETRQVGVRVSCTPLSGVRAGRDIASTASPVNVDVAVLEKAGVLLTGHHTEGVGTEVITLSLEEVGGNHFTPVTIEEGKGSRESGGGNTPEASLSDDTPPSGLCFVNSLVEEVVEEQRLEVLVLLVSGSDVTKEHTLDDTSTSPHTSNASVVQGPVQLLGSLPHEHKALRVRDDLGGIQCLFKIINELLLVTAEGFPLRAIDNFAGTHALLLDCRQATCEHSLADKRNGSASVKGSDCCPFSGTFLTSLVKNFCDEGFTVVVVEFKNVGSNLDEEGVKDTLVPRCEDVSDLAFVDTKATLKNIIGLSDQLHVTIFDTIVNHLNVVTRTSLANPVTAGFTVDLGSGFLEDLLDSGPGSS